MFQDILSKATTLRKQLHQQPELTWQERNTALLIRDQLDTLGIEWEASADTGTIGRLAKSKPGKHIALRGDIDALPIHEKSGVAWTSERPGCMHACGHDGHTASLMATAMWLKQCEQSLSGPVSLFFQPAEEGGHGAKKMIEDGALKGVDEIYGWHNWPAIPYGQAVCPEGPVMSANSSFDIFVSGVGGHASQPEASKDPVLAGSAIVVALQQIVSRLLPPQVSAVVTVTSFEAKSAKNVIPAAAQLGGGIRASNTKVRELISEKMTQIVADTAKAYGCKAEIQHEPCYGATVNHGAASERFKSALQQEFGDDWQSEDIPIPIMASEDFSYFLNEIPGAFALIGANDGEEHSHSCHSPYYDFNDKLIRHVVRLYARLVGAPIPD